MTDSLILVAAGIVFGCEISFIGYCVFQIIQSEIKKRERKFECLIREKVRDDILNSCHVSGSISDLRKRIEILEEKK